MMMHLPSGSGRVCCEFDEAGKDALAILTHGYLSGRMSRTNAALIPLLNSRGISTIAFDIYGHGGSEGDVRRLTVSKAVDNALAVYDHAAGLGYRKISFCASSFSGPVALISATKRRYCALALRCPVFDGKALWDSRLGESGLKEWRERRVIAPFGRDWDFEVYEDESRYDMREVAAAVDAPTLVVHGDHDSTVPLSQARDLSASLKCEKRLVVVPGADHRFGPPEHFQAVLDETVGWISRFS